MPVNLRYHLWIKILAAWKFLFSLSKREWAFSDYPVVFREQEIDSRYIGTRLRQHRFTASVVNWWVLSGGGDTKQEAFEDLAKAFERTRLKYVASTKPLPRPGRHVPIQFAWRERVNSHPELAEDFSRRVLNLEWAWISDKSSLGNFHQDDTDAALVSRIREIYGVDVSDIKSGNLADILDRIATKQAST